MRAARARFDELGCLIDLLSGAGGYLEITLLIGDHERPEAVGVYEKYRQQFLDTVPGAQSKQLLVRTEDVQVLHGFDSVEHANAYLASDLFSTDVGGELAPLLRGEPEIRVFDVA